MDRHGDRRSGVSHGEHDLVPRARHLCERTGAGESTVVTTDRFASARVPGVGHDFALILVLAATMATTEFRYGTASGTYLAVPSKMDRVIGAKSNSAAAIVGGLYGVAASTVTVVIDRGVAGLGGEVGAAGRVGARRRSRRRACGAPTARRSRWGSARRCGAGSSRLVGLLGWLFVAEPLGIALVAPVRALAAVRGGRRAPHSGARATGQDVFGWAAGLAIAAIYVSSVWASAVSL